MRMLNAWSEFVSRKPGWVVAGWLALAAALGATAPDLTRLAAEGQAHLLPEGVESARAAELIKRAWPEQSYDSLAVVALHRPGGLTADDRAYARRLATRLSAADRPPLILRVLGPDSPPEIAGRLVSPDGTLMLLPVALGKAFVSPATQDVVAWLERQPAALGGIPPGLRVLFSGDAVIGRDYMWNVKISLDRAEYATIVLLAIVLLVVYRSFLLALVPLATIGVGLVISRAVLGWMAWAGWEVSSLLELFLVVLLFGSGTDFCLFLSWRFGENWNAADPAAAMRRTLRRSTGALLTSAGTVIIGLTLMGTTRFKLFSTTGPSVALGLGLTLPACLSLTPALLILLARHRPRTFRGLTAPPSGIWDIVGHAVLRRPLLSWTLTIAVMAPVAFLGLRTEFIEDLLQEVPGRTPSVENLHGISAKFGPGVVAPLTVVLRSDRDLRDSQGLALIDDVSRLLSHQRRLTEVRSATQPLGSSAPLEPARLNARLEEVNEGFARIAEGAKQLQEGLVQGAAKLRTAILLEDLTGLRLTGPAGSAPSPGEATSKPAAEPSTSSAMISGLRLASGALLGLPLGGMTPSTTPKPEESAPAAAPPPSDPDRTPAAPAAPDPRATMLSELDIAAEGAGQIADGARRARREIALILNDPVGHRALDRLLIRPDTIREHPELLRSFAAYLSPDGLLTRFDVSQADRIFSAAAMDEVGVLRRRLHDYLSEVDWMHANAVIAGANAASADIWDLTRRDQYQTWVIVPLGVFVVLLLALRDVWACINLVATMLLTYAFALGVTHLVFVTALGAPGLDWKVPYFLFVLLVAVGVDYNVFLMTRLQEEARVLGLRAGIPRAVAQTGGLISSAAAITACSFASFLFSPLSSIRQLGFALVIGITVDAALVRPLLVPCGHWLLNRRRERKRALTVGLRPMPALARVPD